MSGLKQELGLGQGVGLLSTSLLGTGVFAVPALAALAAACDEGRVEEYQPNPMAGVAEALVAGRV